uniref:Uncharacterized protein n=1 Tax=Rhizophora mucronata TaxID=61149 RepID=A0A2P2QWR6_RHIMU
MRYVTKKFSCPHWWASLQLQALLLTEFDQNFIFILAVCDVRFVLGSKGSTVGQK